MEDTGGRELEVEDTGGEGVQGRLRILGGSGRDVEDKRREKVQGRARIQGKTRRKTRRKMDGRKGYREKKEWK